MKSIIRPIEIIEHPDSFAEGCVTFKSGATEARCTASIDERVPRFLKDKHAWITAEYSMLPRATQTRNDREVNRGKISPRSSEIQRLIGRSLRAGINLKSLSGFTIIIDCDIIHADGSTRCAAINGGQIALIRAIQKLQLSNKLHHDPVRHLVGAVSAGIIAGEPILDLNYKQDSKALVDLNIIMSDQGDLIEIQGGAEKKPFSRAQLNTLLDMAWPQIESIIHSQKAILETPYPYDTKDAK